MEVHGMSRETALKVQEFKIKLSLLAIEPVEAVEAVEAVVVDLWWDKARRCIGGGP